MAADGNFGALNDALRTKRSGAGLFAGASLAALLAMGAEAETAEVSLINLNDLDRIAEVIENADGSVTLISTSPRSP